MNTTESQSPGSIQQPGYAAFGRYKVNGVSVIECLGCGGKEPVKTSKHRKLFRERHGVCHKRHNR